VRLTVLASGSGGNSILVESDRTRVLVDAGLAARQIALRLERTLTTTRLDDVQAVLLTHEHTDHITGIPALASTGLPIYTTPGTARAGNLTKTIDVGAGQPVTIGALEVLPVKLPHDAEEPVGFIFSDGKSKAGILTDCGHPDAAVAAAYRDCDILVLETNHDADMLRAGSYPPSLKRRIGGNRGHLSNEQAAEMLRLMGKPAVRVLILAHLSQLNNRPRIARSVVERTLAGMGAARPRLLLAIQEHPLAPVTCEDGKIEIMPLTHDRQLCLAFPDT
jgi:phosphoribosyl 1,2-cyclic phosphodiesterase